MRACYLRTALGVNGTFSLTTGLTMMLAPGVVGAWIGMEQSNLLRVIGGSLLAFACLLFYLAAISRRPQFLAVLASLGDFGWVAGTVGLGIFAPNVLSGQGWLIVIGVAVVVLACGVAQVIGIDRVYRHRDRAGWMKICLEFQSEVDPQAIWSIVRDVGEIHKYAPSLTRSSVVEHDAALEPTVRECQDTKGNCWREELTIDDQEMRLDVKFLADRPGFPFPFRAMEGGWDIDSGAAGSRLQVWWDVMPKQRLAAFAMLPLFSFMLQSRFQAVIENMSDTALGISEQERRSRRREPIIARGC